MPVLGQGKVHPNRVPALHNMDRDVLAKTCAERRDSLLAISEGVYTVKLWESCRPRPMCDLLKLTASVVILSGHAGKVGLR